MRIRCPNCKAETKLPKDPEVLRERCNYCGENYSLAGWGELGATLAERHRAARKFAEEKQLELSGAYSALLGGLPIDQVRRAVRAQEAGASESRSSVPLAYAIPVAALGIAVMFFASLDRQGDAKRPVIASLAKHQDDERPPVPTEDLPPPVARQTYDERGRVTRIYGKTALDVLRSYCASGSREAPCTVLGIEPSPSNESDIRIGVFQSPRGDGSELSIRIVQEDGNWFCGNGMNPIQAKPFTR